jgi:hypothetical protein
VRPQSKRDPMCTKMYPHFPEALGQQLHKWVRGRTCPKKKFKLLVDVEANRGSSVISREYVLIELMLRPPPIGVTTSDRKNRQHAGKSKRTAALMSFDIGIAEGGARTHDLEVDLFAVIRATRSTN